VKVEEENSISDEGLDDDEPKKKGYYYSYLHCDSFLSSMNEALAKTEKNNCSHLHLTTQNSATVTTPAS
jgi:hypothetical protein